MVPIEGICAVSTSRRLANAASGGRRTASRAPTGSRGGTWRGRPGRRDLADDPAEQVCRNGEVHFVGYAERPEKVVAQEDGEGQPGRSLGGEVKRKSGHASLVHEHLPPAHVSLAVSGELRPDLGEAQLVVELTGRDKDMHERAGIPFAADPAKNRLLTETSSPFAGSASPLWTSTTTAASLTTTACSPTSPPSPTSSSRAARTARSRAASAIPSALSQESVMPRGPIASVPSQTPGRPRTHRAVAKTTSRSFISLVQVDHGLVSASRLETRRDGERVRRPTSEGREPGCVDVRGDGRRGGAIRHARARESAV